MAFSASNYQPVAGTYTALLATGDPRLIHDDDSLRSRIVAYAAGVENERELLRDLRRVAFGDMGRVTRTMPVTVQPLRHGRDERLTGEQAREDA